MLAPRNASGVTIAVVPRTASGATIAADHRPDAKSDAARWILSRTDAAVVITNLRGYTDLSERLAPDTLLQLLGTYFEVVVEAE